LKAGRAVRGLIDRRRLKDYINYVAFQRPRIIRPPSEWRSYFLPITSGCSNARCTFCNYYYGARLRIRRTEEVREEIEALYLYKKHGIFVPSMPPLVYELADMWDGRRIFLQDGDALVYPFKRLKEILEHLNTRFPAVERIAAYATPQDLLRRTVEELRALRELKLSILYMGLESGSDEILSRVHKGVDSRAMVEAARKAKEASITLSVTVILGLGGREASKEHAISTARVLSEMQPEFVGALTLTLVPPAPLYTDWKEGRFQPLSPFESLEELRLMIEHLELRDCFFSSTHASNYFTVKGRLPEEKERMLMELDEILQKRDPRLLRPEYLRGL
jgi:radical SAM superfamily enzyme YgiQ (UPF0313 family)